MSRLGGETFGRSSPSDGEGAFRAFDISALRLSRFMGNETLNTQSLNDDMVRRRFDLVERGLQAEGINTKDVRRFDGRIIEVRVSTAEVGLLVKHVLGRLLADEKAFEPQE